MLLTSEKKPSINVLKDKGRLRGLNYKEHYMSQLLFYLNI